MRLYLLLFPVLLAPLLWGEGNAVFDIPNETSLSDTVEADSHLRWVEWGERKVQEQPAFPFEEFNHSGKVVVHLCVDPAGTPKRVQIIPGATSLWEPVLYARVKKHALSCRLQPDQVGPACGKLVYTFRMK